MHLIKVNISHYDLEGPISDVSMKAQFLEILDLSYNRLSGNISDIKFNNLPKLSQLNLSNNELTGCPPVVSQSVLNCNLTHNMLGFNQKCNISSCDWRHQHYYLRNLEPSRLPPVSSPSDNLETPANLSPQQISPGSAESPVLSSPAPSEVPSADLSPSTGLPMSPANAPSLSSGNDGAVWIIVMLSGVFLGAVVLVLLWLRRRRKYTFPKQDIDEEVALMKQDEREMYAQVDSLKEFSPSDIAFSEISIGEKLGEGSYGEIYKAKWHGQNVVVKRVKSSSLDQTTILEEARTLISLHHKHIVLSMGISKNEETNDVLLVMEYMKNGSLEDLLFRDKVTLKRQEIITLALDVAKGLNYLHSLNPKIIHRDLKGANVLLYQNKKRAKISDFGTARLLHTSSAASTVIGTFGFIAPEILQEAPYNEKADIYSFGVLLFEMVSNTHLAVIFDEEKRIERISEVVQDPEFKQLVINCCRTDPIERPSIRRCIEILKQIKAK